MLSGDPLKPFWSVTSQKLRQGCVADTDLMRAKHELSWRSDLGLTVFGIFPPKFSFG